MNVRQFELIKILLTSTERYALVDQLAEKVGCSEKTVRNDLKDITDFFVAYSNIRLHRKPGRGIFLQGTEVDRQQVLDLLQAKWEKSSEERIFDIAYELLTAQHPLTLQQFADKHFTNKTTVKKDLDIIADWLLAFEINLYSKQKVGVFLDGAETKRRSAMAHLPQLASNHDYEQTSITRLFPEQEVNIVKTVLNRADFSYTDETFDRLVIHILIMIKRIKQKSPIQLPKQNMEITEKAEFKQAKQLMLEIEPFFAIRIPDSEIIYLAWHLISGKKRTADEIENPFLEKLVTKLIEQMTQLTKIDFTSDITLFQGLSVHLEPVLNRLSYQLPIKNPLLTEIKKMYPYMFSMVILTLERCSELFSMMLPEDEAAYIVLHFQASVERRKRMVSQKKRAIIVCHLGIGMSHLLRSRIERQISDLQIEHCVSRADLNKFASTDFDMIISTIDLPNVSAPHIVISPLFDSADQDRLQAFIKNEGINKHTQHQYATLLHFIDDDSIFLQVDQKHRYEIVELLATSLHDRGFVKREYIHSALLRERMSATSIGSSIAIPHGNPSDILHSGIAVATLKEPIEWGKEQVSLVFLLAVVHEEQQVIKQLFNEISLLSEQSELVKELSKQTKLDSFLNKLPK
ncbi:BglG family transcription antiterminator [Lederbergia lenta]|uniref:Transcriptional antiterminator n=1 Tax=Lederbergia lenta TaxID=1467 RepID=A0A2X4WGK7_LEDLE|nr:BglG family transcription antiterminator [Lederbergia lenta]MEC2323029.1 BglG family transcription antiterminator [Lederbergia lenta]SQI62231.1 transcriptional antiterminator [Lederbergia lenta]